MQAEMSAALYIFASSKPNSQESDYAELKKLSAVKYGILTHISSDLPALQAVLRNIEASKIDHIVCAGNTTGRPENANVCIDTIRERDIPTILGDFDEVACGLAEPWGFDPVSLASVLMTRDHLSVNNLSWLRALPMDLSLPGFAVVNGRPKDSKLSLAKWDDLAPRWPFSGEQHGEVCFTNHPAESGVFYERGAPHPDEDGKHVLNKDTNVFITPGRVGRQSESDPWATYGMFDTEERSYQQVYVSLAQA